jgi:hypothetical protein
MVHHIMVVHQSLFALVAPVNIMYALLALMKVLDMPGPVLTQDFVPISTHVANFLKLLNPLYLLLSLIITLIERQHLMAIFARVTWFTLHLEAIFNIIS